MATPSPANVLLGRGAILLDRFTSAGVRTGLRHLGNCDTLGLGITTEKITMKDYTQQTSANYAESIVSTDVAISISGFEFDAENLALTLLGNTAVLAQSAGAVTAEVLALSSVTGLKGKFFRTANVKISAVVLKQGATTLVLNTDYTVFNENAGIIQVLSTSPTVADGTALTVDYTKAVVNAATDIKQVFGAVLAECVGELVFVSNNSTGGNQMLRVFKASLTPNGELGLISDEYGKWSLSGKALSDAAGTYGGSVASPYFTLQEVK